MKQKIPFGQQQYGNQGRKISQASGQLHKKDRLVRLQRKSSSPEDVSNKMAADNREDLEAIQEYVDSAMNQKNLETEKSTVDVDEEDDLETLKSLNKLCTTHSKNQDENYKEINEEFAEDSYEKITSLVNQAETERWFDEEEVECEEDDLENKRIFAKLQNASELSLEEIAEVAAEETQRAITEKSVDGIFENPSEEIGSLVDQAKIEEWLEESEDAGKINRETECLEAKRILSKLRASPDLSQDEIIEVVSKELMESPLEKNNVLAQQVAESFSPYEYGKKVMEANELCYIEDILHIYNGRYWQKLDDEALKQLVYDSLPEAIKLSTKGVENFITNISNYVKREMKKAYDNGKKRFTPKDFQTIENRIVFRNIVYDVRTGETYRFSPMLPYYYAVDCNYLGISMDTPYYDKFKSDATGGDVDSMEMFDLMQAYLLMPNRKGKCFFVMSYAKDSGKTSFGEFIEGYFAEDLVQKIDIEHLGSKFSYAGMDNALMVSCLEMPVTRLTRSAAKALKNFTGESRMEVEAKYQNRITSKVRFKILLASNGGLYLPPGYSDNAFYRRAIVIPFIYSVPIDRLAADLPRKWEEEQSAIISKCVRKFRKIIAEDGGIVFPESWLSKEIKAGWMGQSMINENFVKEALVFTAKNEDAIPKSDLKAEYDRYYAENIIGTGHNLPMQCSKEELVKLIHSIYPNTTDKRLRRSTLNNPKAALQHCITGIKWADGFGCSAAETDNS